MEIHLKEEYNGTWAEQTIIVRGTGPARTEAACSAGGGFLLLRFFPLPFSFCFFLVPLFSSSSFFFLGFSLSSDHFALNKATKTCRVSWNAHKMIDLKSWGTRLSAFWAKHTTSSPVLSLVHSYFFHTAAWFDIHPIFLIYSSINHQFWFKQSYRRETK